MKGSAFVQTLPKGRNLDEFKKRDSMIFDAVRRGDHAPINWVPVEVVGPNKEKVTFYVSQDTLRVGDADDSVRVTTSHEAAQKIADALGVTLLTSKLSDEIYRAADIKLKPIARNWYADGTMAHTSRMVEQSQAVDAQIFDAMWNKRFDGPPLVAGQGKDWVYAKALWQRPGMGAEYGWHITPAKGHYKSVLFPGEVGVLQPQALAHPIGYTDYSQVVRLVRRDVKLCDPDLIGCIPSTIDYLATSDKYWPIVTHEGKLPEYRHPGVSTGKQRPPRPAPPGTDKPKPIPPAKPSPKNPPHPPKAKSPAPVVVASMSEPEKILYLSAGAVSGFAFVSWLKSRP
jgi:hypothetical protein